MAPEIKFTPFGIPYIVEFSDVFFLSNKSRDHKIPRSPSLPVLNQSARPALSRSSTWSSSKLSKIKGLFVFPKNRRNSNSSSRIAFNRFRSGTIDSVSTQQNEKSYAAAQDGSTLTLPLNTERGKSSASLPLSLRQCHGETASDWSNPPPLPLPVVTPSTDPYSNFYADGLYILSAGQDVRPRSVRSVIELRRIVANVLKQAGMENAEGIGQANTTATHPRHVVAQLSRGDYSEFEAALRTVGLTYERCMETKSLPDGRSCVAMLDRKGLDEKAEDASLKFCPATRLGTMFVTKTRDNGRVELRKFTIWA
jgi:hypothetical protein